MSIEAKEAELNWVIIRMYRLGEYPQLHDFYKDNWPKTYIFPNLGREPNEEIFVAENNGQMVGGIFYRKKDDHAFLLNLVVRKDARRQGIASELIKFAQEQAVRDKLPKLTITAKNR